MTDTNPLVSGKVLTDMLQSPSQNVGAMENQFVVSRAINLVTRDLDWSPHEAIAAICRDWMELRAIEVLSENQLAHSTPVDFKPTVLDRIKQFL